MTKSRPTSRETEARLIEQLSAPARAVGGFFEMSLDTFVKIWRRPFQFREFLDQTWMIARVSLVPTLLVAIPFTVLVAFTLNILLRELGAADLSGAGTAFGTISQLGPVVTVLVVAGAGATAICADLGARTIREEIDAMRVLGIEPIQRLVVPRVLASTVVALLLNGLVCAIGLAGGYVFCVFLQGVNPGAFINGLTVLTGLGELVLAEVKALLFGVVAGLVGCYRGLTVQGGPKGVGAAVNETVVSVERSLNDIYPLLTPSYRQEFKDRANKDIIPQARERQLVSQANTVGVGVLAAQRNSGSVMVYLNRTVTDKSKRPVYDGSRLKVDYVKVDGQWLINYIPPI